HITVQILFSHGPIVVGTGSHLYRGITLVLLSPTVQFYQDIESSFCTVAGHIRREFEKHIEVLSVITRQWRNRFKNIATYLYQGNTSRCLELQVADGSDIVLLYS